MLFTFLPFEILYHTFNSIPSRWPFHPRSFAQPLWSLAKAVYLDCSEPLEKLRLGRTKRGGNLLTGLGPLQLLDYLKNTPKHIETIQQQASKEGEYSPRKKTSCSHTFSSKPLHLRIYKVTVAIKAWSKAVSC